MSTPTSVSLPRRDPLVFRVLDEPGPELRSAMRALEAEGDMLRRGFVTVLDPSVEEEAIALLVQLDAACMSGALARDNPATVAAWLHKLNAGQSKPLAQKPLDEVMLPSILTGSGDLPARAFCLGTLAEALRTISFIGSARIDAVVRPVGERLQRQRQRLRALVATTQRERAAAKREAKARPSEQEREAVLADFRRKMERDVRDAVAAGIRYPLPGGPPAPAPLPLISMELPARVQRARDRLARAKGTSMEGYLAQVLSDLEAQEKEIAADGQTAMDPSQPPSEA